jgi:hypothetical protein
MGDKMLRNSKTGKVKETKSQWIGLYEIVAVDKVKCCNQERTQIAKGAQAKTVLLSNSRVGKVLTGNWQEQIFSSNYKIQKTLGKI